MNIAQIKDGESDYVDRLVSFAKLAGDILYFSPTDPVQDLVYDFGRENVYIHGVRIAKKTTNERKFVDSLATLFRPLEPSLTLIYNNDTICKAPKPEVHPDIVSMQNIGLPLYSLEKPQFRSIRINRRSPLSDFYSAEVSLAEFKIPNFSKDEPVKFRFSLKYKNPEKLTVEFPTIEGMQKTSKLSPGSGVFNIEQVAHPSQTVHIKIRMDDLRDLYIQTDTILHIGGQKYSFKNLQNSGEDQPVKEIEIKITGNDAPLYPEKNEIGDTLRTELSERLHASFPLAVYADEDFTYPRASYVRENYPYNKGAIHNLGDSSLLNTDIKLSNLLQLWNVFRYAYVYNPFTEKQQVDLLKSTLLEVMETKNVVDYHKVVSKFLAKYKDGHIASYIDDLTYDEYSVPISIKEINGKMYAKTIYSKELAGEVSPGDQLIEIDGIPIQDMIKKLSPYKSGSDNNIKKFLESKLLSGKESSKARLIFKEYGTGNLKTLETFRTFTNENQFSGSSILQDHVNGLLRPDTYYFNISKSNLTDTLMEFINDPTKNIVFDIRGYVSEDVYSRNLIGKLISDTVVHKNMYAYHILSPMRKQFSQLPQTYVPENRGPKAKMYFLTDNSAISAAETFLDIVKYSGTGEIIGEPTAGANGDVNGLFLPGRMFVMFSGVKVLNADGSKHHLIGVLPDHPVSYSVQDLADNEDPFIRKALELIER